MATKIKPWLASQRRLVAKAVEAGEPLQRCDCCGGYLPPRNVWEELRMTGRGPDCDGSTTTDGNCRAFADVMP